MAAVYLRRKKNRLLRGGGDGRGIVVFIIFLIARLLLLLRAVETRVLAALLSGVVQWLCRVSSGYLQFPCQPRVQAAVG
jgi:hypothetical protein